MWHNQMFLDAENIVTANREFTSGQKKRLFYLFIKYQLKKIIFLYDI